MRQVGEVGGIFSGAQRDRARAAERRPVGSPLALATQQDARAHRARALAGVASVAHDLRRPGPTQLSVMGCPDEVAKAILSRMTPGVKGIYNLHKYDAERRTWLTRWAALLEALKACA